DDELAVDFASRQQRAGVAHAEADRYVNAPAFTASGERVQLLINVADGSELDRLDPACCDGVGLVRTELMLRNAADLADEEKQHQADCSILQIGRGAGGE